MFVPGAAIAIWLLRQAPAFAQQRRAPDAPGAAAPPRVPIVPLLAVIGVMMSRSWTIASLQAFLPTWYKSLGYGASFSGPLATALVLSSALGTIGCGTLADRFGRRAVVLLRLGRGDEALREVAAAAAEIHKREGRFVERARVDVDTFHAQILIETGRAAEAVAPARRASDSLRAELPYDNPRRATAECMLGWALMGSGRDGEGRATLARCLPGFRTYGLTDPVALAAIEKLLAKR
jgi:hypothetical protein